MKIKQLTLPAPDICHAPPSQYYVFNGRDWIRQDRTMVQVLLTSKGVPCKTAPGSMLSPMEQSLLDLSLKQHVSYADRIAGYNAGIYEMGGHRVLVTQSPDWIEPLPGAYPLLTRLFTELLGEKQLPYFYSWLHVAMKMFQEQEFRPGQVLIMAGAPDCGKSLLQALITYMFGGRQAQPYQFMAGDTAFNSDLVGAAHLVISDEGPRYGSARDKVGLSLKKFAVEHVHRCCAKGVAPLEVGVLQRITMTLNDDDQSLLAVPPMRAGISDKVMLFRLEKSQLVQERGGVRKAFWADLTAELPAFLHMISEWEIKIENGVIPAVRMGVECYHDQTLMDDLGNLENYTRLLEIIDETIFPFHKKLTVWHGTAIELQKELCDLKAPYHTEAGQLLRYENTCGRLLSDLSRQRPERVTKDKWRRGKQTWDIKTRIQLLLLHVVVARPNS